MFENDVEGFGIGTSQDVAELNKALTAGYEETTSMTGGAALRVQSLENTLKLLTFREDHMVMWKDISKLPAYSTVEEYSQQTSVGSDNPGFTGEGVAPEEDDSGYARKASLVKFLGTTRKITHPMQLVRTINGDAVARESTNGILKVMRDAEFGLLWGNSDLVYTAAGTTPEGLEWDGLNVLIDATNDLDLSNRNLEEGDFTTMGETIANSFGYINRCYVPNSVASTLDVSLLPKERIALPGANGMEVGTNVGSVKTSFGKIAVRPSLFMGAALTAGRSPKKTPPAAATSTKAPAAPASIAASSLTAQVGVCTFKATACNRYGESAPTAATSNVTVGAGDVAKHIPLAITNSASSETVIPDYFNIYCSPVGTAAWYLVASVPCTDKTNSGTGASYNYTGYIMPNTAICFAGQFDSEILVFKQLAPIMKMDLAVIEPSYRFMILLYGVPQLFAPKKLMRVINVKDY